MENIIVVVVWQFILTAKNKGNAEDRKDFATL
jgi:hypothetical protein